MSGQERDERMVSRIPAASPVPLREPGQAMPRFMIVIPAADGTELLRMTEDEAGRLSVTGDESRWDEGARRFLHVMMQWSGVVGIRWKEEAIRAVEGR
jgi:hypothetical protein